MESGDVFKTLKKAKKSWVRFLRERKYNTIWIEKMQKTHIISRDTCFNIDIRLGILVYVLKAIILCLENLFNWDYYYSSALIFLTKKFIFRFFTHTQIPRYDYSYCYQFMQYLVILCVYFIWFICRCA